MKVTETSDRVEVEKKDITILILTFAALAVSIAMNLVQGYFLQADVRNNQKSITYICSTTSVLDNLVVAAAGQIEQNFKNGTYGKLERAGVLSDKNVAAAETTLEQYRAAHQKLQHTAACRG